MYSSLRFSELDILYSIHFRHATMLVLSLFDTGYQTWVTPILKISHYPCSAQVSAIIHVPHLIFQIRKWRQQWWNATVEAGATPILLVAKLVEQA